MAQDAWTETALVTLNIQGVTGNFNMACMTETINVDTGERGQDFIATLCGGRIPKFNPEEPTTISLEGYPIEVGVAEGSDAVADGAKNFLYGAVSLSGSSQEITPTRARRKVRIAIRWTSESSVAAEDILIGNEDNLRFLFVDGYVNSVKDDFTDNILKSTMEIQFPPFDRAAAANFKFQSTVSTGATPADDLAALADYTTANKF